MMALRLWSMLLAVLVMANPGAAQAPPDPATGAGGTPAASTPAASPSSDTVEPAAAPAGGPQAAPAASMAAPEGQAVIPTPSPAVEATSEAAHGANGAPPGDFTAAPPASATAALGMAGSAAAGAQPPPPPPEPTLIVSADLGSQRVTITENGRAKYTWPISSGTRGYRTKTGRFTPTWTSRMHYSRQWDWAPMPYAVFFNRGTAFHGTYATRSLGRPASHGCIRLTTSNAKTLYNLVHKHGTRMTRVIVHGAPKFNEPQVASRRRDPYASYDYEYPRPRRIRGGYAYADPYFAPRRRPRYVERPYRGPNGGLWD